MDQNKAIKFLYNLSSKLNKFYKSNSKKKLIINNKSKRKKIFNPVTNFDKGFEQMLIFIQKLRDKLKHKC